MFVHRLNGEIIGSGANPQTDRAPEIADENNAAWMIFKKKLDNHSTLSKLKAIDYFIDTNQFDAFMAFIEADKKREQRWNAAQNLGIDDPMMDDYCSEFNVSDQQLQGLFNALNT
ncbi:MULTISPECIES: hypothetical protein [unclassified Methylophaga]|jgi:hypothetical protein|uniref:hypothetical protein n=1 Tax=unclassified Methylophaga TaxID=2629249 RepID=UPI00259C69D7|nr:MULTISPECIES: hypothetical protein [unclassified Methylophaga]|tara:strand:- start:6291 stop:6635 length:345 start_codon:yes stop_codon:yes gene_type:complete